MTGRLLLTLLLLGVAATCAAGQERQWALDSSEDDAYLIFGVPDTGDVGVSFWCTMRSGEIRLFVPESDEKLKPEETIAYSLEVGGEKFDLSGRTMANEEAGSISIESTLEVSAPLFAALQKADRFTIRAGTNETIYPLTDADIEGLLRLCRKP